MTGCRQQGPIPKCGTGITFPVRSGMMDANHGIPDSWMLKPSQINVWMQDRIQNGKSRVVDTTRQEYYGLLKKNVSKGNAK